MPPFEKAKLKTARAVARELGLPYVSFLAEIQKHPALAVRIGLRYYVLPQTIDGLKRGFQPAEIAAANRGEAA